MSTENQKKVRQCVGGSPVGTNFLWWDGFMKNLGFKSGTEKGWSDG